LGGVPNDAARAEYWADWAERAIAEGRWREAEAALERAQDFADSSSDLSFLLALALRHEGRPQRAILEAARRAVETDRWNKHNAGEARLIEAAVLIRLRSFEEALSVLSRLPQSGENAPPSDLSSLRLEALLGAGNTGAFRAEMAVALDRFPNDARPVRLLFRYAADRLPRDEDRLLVDKALARLDLYLDAAPDLAFMAAPFIRDIEEARLLVLAYLAGEGPDPAALPVALNLGVIDEAYAVSELFRTAASGDALTLDRDVIQAVWKLLRNDEGRRLFTRNLLHFSGVIKEDDDRDGAGEAFVLYEDGEIKEYRRDADQDGVFERLIRMRAGEPSSAVILAASDSGGRQDFEVFWERYPWVERILLDGTAYIFRPRSFPLNPLRFGPLAGDGVFLYPFWGPDDPRLTERTLVSFAGTIERPGREFPGAVERVEMEGGVPQSAAEYLRGRAVSVTEYRNGRPLSRRLDLDLDGRMETLRRFRAAAVADGDDPDIPPYEPFGGGAVLESSESDWDGDGIYETGEEYLEDGRVVRSWDINRDGIRGYREIHDDGAGGL
jgi:tetratricopeptide (TPR) repeat protein